MQLTNLVLLLPAVALANPIITDHHTVSPNPIQVHKDTSSWWQFLKRHSRRDFVVKPEFVVVKPGNTTQGWTLPADTYAPHRESTAPWGYIADVPLKDILVYMHATTALISAAEDTKSIIRIYSKNPNVLSQIQLCLDHTTQYIQISPNPETIDEFQNFKTCVMGWGIEIFTTPKEKRDITTQEDSILKDLKSRSNTKIDSFIKQYTNDPQTLTKLQECQRNTEQIFKRPIPPPMDEFKTFASCVERFYRLHIFSLDDIFGSSKEIRDISTGKTNELDNKSPEDLASRSDARPATDIIEGHSMSFWSKLMPHQSPAEIKTFLQDLGGFYEQKKTGTHSSQIEWRKRDNTQSMVDKKEEQEHRLKANKKWQLTRGAMVRSGGHWDGNMRSKNLDEVVECGPFDLRYLNERCVKSSQSV